MISFFENHDIEIVPSEEFESYKKQLDSNPDVPENSPTEPVAYLPPVKIGKSVLISGSFYNHGLPSYMNSMYNMNHFFR